MLVLGRKVNESTYLILPNGEEIKIMVTRVRGENVGLGFEAPDDVIIKREEHMGLDKNPKPLAPA